MRRTAIFLFALLLVGTACSSDDPAASPSGSPSTFANQQNGGTVDVQVTGEAGSKPVITIPDGQPPATLQIKDLTVGTGAEAAAASTVTAHYVGISWSTKGEFDASWDSGSPATFPLNRVIPGWQQGIPGMKVGGRRLLIIPPDLGYGPQGAGADIGPNETLVFVVDLTAVA